MSPARVETFVYELHKRLGKTVGEKDFMVGTSRTSGLPAEILEIHSNDELTRIKMRQMPVKHIRTEGEVEIKGGVDMVKPGPECLSREQPYLLVTLKGEGSNIKYEPSFGSLKPVRRPDVVRITHSTRR